MAERSRGSSDSEEQPKLCSAPGNFPGLHKSPAANRETPKFSPNFLSLHIYKKKTSCHGSHGLCPSSLAFHWGPVPAGLRKEEGKGKVKGNFPLLSVLCNVVIKEPWIDGLPLILFLFWTYSWCFSLWQWVSQPNSTWLTENISCYFQLCA